MENIRVVFISAPIEEARKFARKIAEERLAACVNVIPRVDSYYWWDDAVQHEEEGFLIIKTTLAKIDQLIQYIKEEHPYDIPEVLTLPVAEGLPDYVNWVIEEMGKG